MKKRKDPKISTVSALANVYDHTFYNNQVADSLRSARVYLGFLWKFFQPSSILDVGCGRGAWLKVCAAITTTTEILGSAQNDARGGVDAVAAVVCAAAVDLL